MSEVTMREVTIGEVGVGPVTLGPGRPLALIAGPCVIEGREHALRHAAALRRLCDELDVPLVYKSSFDKANRSALTSARGPGLEEGLRILEEVREAHGLPVLTDVHLPEQAAAAATSVDLLQVPAFLCRQTDLLLAAAATGKPVNVKKGQFMAPGQMKGVVDKLHEGGCQQVLLTERGTFFGYNALVVDLAGLPTMQQLGCPVVFDGTHSVQRPGALGDRTGGARDRVPGLTRAAVAAGVDAVFLEVHEDPDQAPCDGPNMLPLDELRPLLETLLRIRAAVDPR